MDLFTLMAVAECSRDPGQNLVVKRQFLEEVAEVLPSAFFARVRLRALA
jgi:hypothetical protein